MAKYALCVGINDYPGTGSDLKGCVNDANDWAAALKARGYDVKIVLDRDAKLKTLVEALTELVGKAAAGDTAVFTFSGHGSWLPDDDGDEPDGRDEMLCPYDVGSEQYLMDDMLAEIFDKKVKGVNLYFISDSCHSGSVAKFAADPVGGRDRMPRIRLLPPLEFVKDEKIRAKIPLASKTMATAGGEKFPALLLSGCKDVEFSYDADFGGRANGAFTKAALTALAANPSTPQEWFTAIKKHLPSQQYPQSPQLFGSRSAKKGPML